MFFSPGEKFKVETRTIAVDFASEDIYDKIQASLAGLKIGVLGLYLCHVYRFFLHSSFDFFCDSVFFLDVRHSVGKMTSEMKVVLLIQLIIR